MLAELAQRVAKNRSAELLREKERVTEQLIDMAKENEAKIRAAAYKKVEYRMLIKAASKCVIEFDREEGSDVEKLVVNLGPEVEEQDCLDELPVVKEEKEEKKANEVVVAGGSRMETETNVPEGAGEEKQEVEREDDHKPGSAESEQEGPPKTPATPDVPYSEVLDAHLQQTPPQTAASSNRPFTAHSKMDPPPPIEWHGDGASLMRHIHAEALLVSVNEKMEEDEIASSAEAKAAAKKEAEAEAKAKKKGKGKGKGRKGKADKSERKERRKKHREEVHGVRLEEQIRLETIGTGGMDLLASSAGFRLGLNHTKEGKVRLL